MDADSDGETQVPIVCPECGTETRIPLSDVGATLDDHNANRHDGEDVADELADLVADDLDLV